jgi:hypothetical protein
LAVTALERRAGDEIAVLVALNYNRKRQVLHARSIFLLQNKCQTVSASHPPASNCSADLLPEVGGSWATRAEKKS